MTWIFYIDLSSNTLFYSFAVFKFWLSPYMNSFWLLYFFQFSCLNWVISVALISLLKFLYVLKFCPYFPLEFLALIKTILNNLHAISKPSVRANPFVDLFLLTDMFFWFWVTCFCRYLFVLLFCVPVNFFNYIKIIKLSFYSCVGKRRD